MSADEERGKIMNDNQCVFVVTFDIQYHYMGVFSKNTWKTFSPYSSIEINTVRQEWNSDTLEDFYYVAVQANTKEQAKKIACDIIATYQYNRQGI